MQPAPSRSDRHYGLDWLLIPLAFGMAVLLPPEMWVRAREAGHTDGLIAYWLRDYWWPADGIGFPAWEHLWLVVYL